MAWTGVFSPNQSMTQKYDSNDTLSIRQDGFSFNQGFKAKLVDQFPREYEMSVESSIDPPKNFRHLATEFARYANWENCAITVVYESIHDEKAPMWNAAS